MRTPRGCDGDCNGCPEDVLAICMAGGYATIYYVRTGRSYLVNMETDTLPLVCSSKDGPVFRTSDVTTAAKQARLLLAAGFEAVIELESARSVGWAAPSDTPGTCTTE